ncbi:MAG: hypothetical protein WKF63_02590 [Thermomicrobiales bacterium]
MDTQTSAPTIARIWRGRTTSENAGEYALWAQMFREDRDGETEFVTISYWESVEAMSRFAGEDPKRIHHLPRDPEFLIELPDGVQVLDIVASEGRVPPPAG